MLASLAVAVVGWTKHKGYNCYPGAGGTSVDPSDTPVESKTVAQCGDVCAGTKGCNAFTVDEYQAPVGPCWLRKSIDLDNCDTDSGYDTYDGGSPPPPPAPPAPTPPTPPPPPPPPPGPWFPPPRSDPWPLPDGALCGDGYTPTDADLSGLTKYTDGDAWIRLVESDSNCGSSHELSKYGITCSTASGMKTLEFAAAVYTLSQQVWLTPNTVIQGAGDPNVPGNPRKRPNLKEQTLFVPGGWDCSTTQSTTWASYRLYDSYLKCQRKGFLLNSYTVLRNFVAQGTAEDGQGLGLGLAGGGLIELPGCGTAYASAEGCGASDEKSDGFPSFPDKSFWTGYDGGTAVHHMLVENLRLNDLIADKASNVVFWSSMTTDDSAHTDVTFRKVVSLQSRADGINVHGSVDGWSGSDIHIENTGDDVYAVWGAGGRADSGMSGRCPRLTNAPATDVSFDRVFAKQKAGGGYGTCFSAFGARKVTLDHMVCCEEHGGPQGIVQIEEEFCAAYPAGTNITVAHASWREGTSDLCSGGDDQWFSEVDLHSTGGCQGHSGRGLCSGGCSWVNTSGVGEQPLPTTAR